MQKGSSGCCPNVLGTPTWDSQRSLISRSTQKLQGVHINLVDFVAAKERGELPYRFPSRKAVAQYTWSTKKRFPLKQAKTNGFLKVFLVQVP
jgi:hypothetical protein